MRITGLQLENFRNYERLDIAPWSETNLFYGKNGSGKTNIIESIYMCAIGRSFRERQDSFLIRQGEKTSRIVCHTEDDSGQGHKISLSFTMGKGGKKLLQIDGKNARAMGEIMGKLRCVLFSPDNLSLIYGGPEERRKFLDTLICQISPTYFKNLSEYNRIMRQRNELLRKIRDGENRFTPSREENVQLDVFDHMLAQCGQIIANRRWRATKQLCEAAGEKYAAISASPGEKFSALYVTCHQDPSKVGKVIEEGLAKNREKDIARCVTSVGIHRDDIAFFLSAESGENRVMKQFASQGQCRTAALSLKLAQISLIRQISGENPVLLLDDVMSELDIIRRRMLTEELRGIQSFITCTDLRDVDGYGSSGIVSSMQTYLVASENGSAACRVMNARNKDRAVKKGVFDLDSEL